MATRLPDASQQAAADAVVDRADGGSPGLLRIYSGAEPADADDAASGDLLVEITLDAPAYGAADTSGTAALAGTPRSGTGTAAAGAGTNAGYFRVTDSAGVTVFQGQVTGTGGGGELILDNISIAENQTVNINSLDYTQPAE